MSDDKTKAGQQDGLRIDVHKHYELRHWSKRVRLHPRGAQGRRQGGRTMSADVETYLKQK